MAQRRQHTPAAGIDHRSHVTTPLVLDPMPTPFPTLGILEKNGSANKYGRLHSRADATRVFLCFYGYHSRQNSVKLCQPSVDQYSVDRISAGTSVFAKPSFHGVIADHLRLRSTIGDCDYKYRAANKSLAALCIAALIALTACDSLDHALHPNPMPPQASGSLLENDPSLQHWQSQPGGASTTAVRTRMRLSQFGERERSL